MDLQYVPSLCIHTPEAYHAYTSSMPSNVLNSSPLCSHYFWLLPQCLIICSIDNPYAHAHIGFFFSTIYNPYASTTPPHLLCRLPCLHSHTALMSSISHPYTHPMNSFYMKCCSFLQLTILMLIETFAYASFPLEIDITHLNANLQCCNFGTQFLHFRNLLYHQITPNS
ncbi:hypothetical protein O181_099578 [Austropuccinia psidii MF-1]|uniref:Uncharacterized protein n=1 Tax=Austropuccinia psidii MF-1 TaxID=1389203 RepID=A0A9Q3PF98_9BASI|nr:hypothetical protein [Austropuccinia psidii MF-1]